MEQYLDLITKYGINNVVMIYLLFQFVNSTKLLAGVIKENTVALTQMRESINKCEKK